MTGIAEKRFICVDISAWKRPTLRAMLTNAGGTPLFARSGNTALALAKAGKGTLAVWASKNNDALLAEAQACGLSVTRIEDGFIRSVGLGAAFTRPASLVVDRCGIYYDPRTPSDLENLLNGDSFTADALDRATALIASLRHLRMTKYNVGTHAHAPLVPEGRTGILVPGQVEDDASIRHGSPVIRTNLGLLRAARARHPDGFIIYKPHPDVAAGYRQGAVSGDEAHALVDAIVTDRSITDLYDECRHVETMTSLAGFEALLRGLTVTTHGQPFYAGWGLTEDLLPHARRIRTRTLPELVAAALILYPCYVHPHTGKTCTVEDVLEALAHDARTINPLRHRLQHLYARSRHFLFGALDRRRRQ